MEVQVFRAIFGDKNKAHALLASSASSAGRALPFSGLTTLTDRPNLPKYGFRWKPYISAYAFGDYYILSKTFPDLDVSRTGMVLTHALAVSLDVLASVADIEPILSLLPDVPDRHMDVSPVQVSLPELGDTEHLIHPMPLNIEQDDIMAIVKATNYLVEWANKDKPVVWVGQDGFSRLVETLWRSLWPDARKELRIGYAFVPQDISNRRWSLISIPETMEGHWQDYPLVHLSETETPVGKAAGYILGLDTGEPIRDLYDALESHPTTIAELRLAEYASGWTSSLNALEAAPTRGLWQIVTKLAPRSEQGQQLKSRILARLTKLIELGAPEDITGLNAIEYHAFAGAEQSVGAAITAWLLSQVERLSSSSNTVTDSQITDVAGLLLSGYTSEETAWGSLMRASTRAALGRWHSNVAIALWQWWSAEPNLVTSMAPDLPDTTTVENDLTACCPVSLKASVADKLENLCRNRRWYLLHAAVVSAHYSAADAIRHQLQVDKGTQHLGGIRVLAARLPDAEIVIAALDLGDKRLLNVAGELCSSNRKLLSNLDVSNDRWRSIWLHSIQAGVKPFDGIPDPSGVMATLLDELVHGAHIDAGLLEHLGHTEYADITHYTQRSRVWKYLEASRILFLQATATGWLNRFQQNQDSRYDMSLEAPLEHVILADATLTPYLEAVASHNRSDGIKLFRRFPALSQQKFLEWLTSVRDTLRSVDYFEAKEIGILARERHWHDVASSLLYLVLNENRNDYVPALEECTSLLGTWDRFRWSFSGKSSAGTLTSELWWKALVEVASRLYFYGPLQHSLWERAGGDPSWIPTNQSGRSMWEDAIQMLRSGGGGKDISVDRLLQEMLGDYHGNPELKELRHAYNRLVK
jgi:hypothetical protein